MASCHGSKNVITLFNLYGSNNINATTAGTPNTLPVTIKCQNLQPAIIIMIAHIPIITTDALKWGSNNNNPMIGANKQICFIKPFLYKFN